MKKKINYKNLLLVCLISFLITGLASAESNQKKKTNLQKKIVSTSSSLKNSRAVSNQLKKRVKDAEERLNISSRELYKTEQEIKRLSKKLSKSNKLKNKLISSTEEQKKALAQQMQALYTSGKQSHLRLLLKQDDPSDISRTSKYFEYMNRYRLKQIVSISKKLKSVKRIQKQISKDTAKLQKLQILQKSKKKKLKAAVYEKERALKKQRKIVLSQEQKLAKLVRQESRLKGVIERLAKKQKKEEKERARALAQKRAKASSKRAKKTKEKQVATKKIKKRTKATKKNPQTKFAQTKPHYVPNKPFSSLRGKLSWPVKGSIIHRYGSPRNSKQRWRAVVIAAPGGTRVRAVARGKVEYSGRLRGYGYVIIIRHDKNYRSIYGYNRSVYKREGQIVRAGEVIAAVGNSGGLSRTGLYFEIRKRTSHQNPAKWCR